MQSTNETPKLFGGTTGSNPAEPKLKKTQSDPLEEHDPFLGFERSNSHQVQTGNLEQQIGPKELDPKNTGDQNFYREWANNTLTATMGLNTMNSSKSKFRIKRSPSITDKNEDNWLRQTGKLDAFNLGTDTNENLENTGTVDPLNITFRNLEVTNDSKQLANIRGNFAKKNFQQEDNFNPNFTATGNTLDLSKPSLQVNKKNKIVVYDLKFDHLEKPPSNEGDRPPLDFSNKKSDQSSGSRLNSATSKKKLVYMGNSNPPINANNNMNHIPQGPQGGHSNFTGKTNLSNLNAKLKAKPNLTSHKFSNNNDSDGEPKAKASSLLNKSAGRNMGNPPQ